MSFSLTPDTLFHQYEEITPDWLHRQGIRLVLSDLDFTLAPKSIRRPDETLHAWIKSLREAGISVVIISNNRSCQRVEEFCSDLGISYQGHSKKPSPKKLIAAMREADASPKETAMLGDKLLTDVLAAHRAGVLSLMVEPRGGAITVLQRVLHSLQAPFKARCPKNYIKKS